MGLKEEIRSRHPGVRAAILADARISSAFRGRPLNGKSNREVAVEALKLAWSSDAFLGQILYRVRMRLHRAGVPILPLLLHRLSMKYFQICIGDLTVIAPGMYLPHGQVVIDGIVEIGPRARILPWTTIGLQAGNFQGPKIEGDCMIGTGAKVLGPVTVGRGARVGANAVVIEDVPPRSTAVGVPARVIEHSGGA